jgi:hypothetical protein
MFVDERMSVLPPSVADTLACPDAAARATTLLEPGPSAVRTLMCLRPDRMTETGLVDALTGIERQIAMLQSVQQEVLTEFARRDPDGERYLREEVACALKLAPATAQQRLDTAVQLSCRLRDTRELIDAGELSYLHGRILATAVEHLPDEVTAKIQSRVLRRACSQTPGEFRAAVRRAVAKYDQRDQNQRHEHAFADRRVVMTPDDDAMCDIYLRLAADAGATFTAGVNARAGIKIDGDQRTVDQRRADAAVELALIALADPSTPTVHGARPTVNITVAATTLLGLDDQPAELDGYPIPAAMARRISLDPSATWRRLITDSAGRLLDYEARIYRPPAALARHVIERDQHCVHPGCRRRAWNCELDHRESFPVGHTNAENLQPLCRRHHLMKHRSAWQVCRNPDGTYRWTSPTRHTYRYRPPELPAPETANDPPPF